MLGTFTLLMAYGAAVIPLAYACAFGFSSHSAAQVLCTAPVSLHMYCCGQHQRDNSASSSSWTSDGRAVDTG